MKIKLFIFWLLFVVLFCFLSYWQLCRYHYKKKLLTSYQQQLTAKPVVFETIKTFKNFQHVALIGEWKNNSTILIQNRLYHDRLGFEVLTAFKIPQKNKYILVDRGWLPQLSDNYLPDIKPILTVQSLTGYIYFPDGYQFILGKNILQPLARPLVVQKIDLAEISKLLQHDFFPFILRLDQNSVGGFTRDWIISAVPPERHLGYAVQWLLMAVVLFILSIRFCFRRNTDGN